MEESIHPVRNNPAEQNALGTNCQEISNEVQHNIKCPIFLETDRMIQSIISKFWKTNSKEKQYYFQDILLEVESLLTCSKYSSANYECLDCYYTLRKYLLEYKPKPSLFHSQKAAK